MSTKRKCVECDWHRRDVELRSSFCHHAGAVRELAGVKYPSRTDNVRRNDNLCGRDGKWWSSGADGAATTPTVALHRAPYKPEV